MNFFRFTVGVLAVWRITHLLHAEDGPWDVAARLRAWAASGFWGGLLGCFYCTSLWVAAPCALAVRAGWKERLLLWPALSAGAIMLDSLVSRSTAQAATPTPPAPYYEEPYYEEEENSDVLPEDESIRSS
jgi:hypothetical protein